MGGFHSRRPAIPTRSRTSFQKRQKEIARMEKQRDKTAKRLQRKLSRAEGSSVSGNLEIDAETGESTLPADENTGMAE